jgi:signal transduction histidine kinase
VPIAASLRHSLSTRLLRLTIGIVLAVEVLIFVPEITHEREAWLRDRMDDAHTAALAAAQPGTPATPLKTTELLRLAGCTWIRLDRPGLPPVILGAATPPPAARVVKLPEEGLMAGAMHALRVLAVDRPTMVRVIDDHISPRGSTLAYVTNTHRETQALRRFARGYVWVSLITASLTGMMVYIAVWLLLVRPMRRVIARIVAFRAAPQNSVNSPLPRRLAKDELAVTERELAAMEQELRDALWRNARLAALGNAVERISHDMRAILAPVLLAAERLQTHADPAVQRTGAMLLRTVDRATDLINRTLDFSRQGPPVLELAPVALALLVDEAAEAARAPSRSFAVKNQVPLTLLVEADRNQFFRVLANLLRNAADAGARSTQVSARAADGMAVIEVADDGPGLPAAVRATLFHPATRSTRHEGVGLGLAIARDLTLAHGGEITLASSGPEGTVFHITLRLARESLAEPDARGTAHLPGIAPTAQADV